MTLYAFTYPHMIDGALCAEYDASVDVLPLSGRRPDPEDDYKLEGLSFSGSDDTGKCRDVEVPQSMRGDVIEWLEKHRSTELRDALVAACQDAEERARDAYDEYREDARDRAREERLAP